MSVYMTKNLELCVEKLRLYSSKSGAFKRDKPAIVYKKKKFDSFLYAFFLYPLHRKEREQFISDRKAIKNIKEAGKELRNRDIDLKVLMASNDVKEEIEMIGVASQKHHDWQFMSELYLRNICYPPIYENKIKLLKNIDYVLECKSLDREKSKRYLKLLREIKQEIIDDIPKGGRDKRLTF